MHNTPKIQLATEVLGEPLREWVVRHRMDDRSWKWIAERLNREAEGKVTVTEELLRRNFLEATAA